MIIYKDMITGDEFFSDADKPEVVDDCVYELRVSRVTRKEGEIVLDGANPSAEGEDADDLAGDDVVSGYDVVLNQRLSSIEFTKKDFMNYLKTYTKALQEKWKNEEWSDDKIADAKSKVTEGAKKMIKYCSNDPEYFMGESQNCDGAIAMVVYREDSAAKHGEQAFMIMLKHGLEAEKV